MAEEDCCGNSTGPDGWAVGMVMMWESVVKCMVKVSFGFRRVERQDAKPNGSRDGAQAGSTNDVKKVAGRWAPQKKPTLDQANLKWTLEVVGPTG